MLYGEFRETSSREVRLDYTGAVLRVVVEFCFTDDGNASHHFGGPKAESFVRSLVRVSAAAHYFDIPHLEANVYQKLTDMIVELPSLACVVYDESINIGNPVEALSRMAEKKIRARPRKSLLPVKDNVGGVRSLDESLLEKIVFDKQSRVRSLGESFLETIVLDKQSRISEFEKFQCLQQWAERGSKGFKAESESSEKISTTITNLAKQLDLSRIPVSKLTSVVEQSHLVTRDDLYQAYRSRALCATDNKIVVKGAGTPEVNGTYIQEGVHQDTPMYLMEGMWEGREVIFSIFLCSETTWYISIMPEGEMPGEPTYIDFYYCDHASNNCWKIPSRGWQPINIGQTPPPTCFVTGFFDSKDSM
mmetsp:Transcript_51397/g.61901  ORF Transcript_51397/g.61901 Transcript_51397/m.61901 type:complete len:362 (-) Transcript_51397:89-1174(-)